MAKKVGNKTLIFDRDYVGVKTNYEHGTNINVIGEADRAFYERMKANLRKYPSYSHINQSNYEQYYINTENGPWGSLKTYEDVRYILAYIQTQRGYKEPLTLEVNL